MFKDRMNQPLSTGQIVTKMVSRFLSYGLDLKLMILRWVGCIPSHYVRRFFYRLSGIKIGSGSTFHMFCNFYQPRNIRIGKDTIVGYRTFLDGRDKLTIGSHVAIASEVMVYNSQHDIDSEDFKPITAPVVIEDYVFIGPRAIILPGITIGKGAVIAAGAVVAENVPPLTLVGGVPAKSIRKREIKDLKYKIGRARWFQ